MQRRSFKFKACSTAKYIRENLNSINDGTRLEPVCVSISV